MISYSKFLTKEHSEELLIKAKANCIIQVGQLATKAKSDQCQVHHYFDPIALRMAKTPLAILSAIGSKTRK